MDQIVRLTLLIVPEALYRSMPMVAVIASVTLFVTLARSSEIVVARSAGRSALRSLGAPLGIAVMIGLISVGILNPIVAATSRQYEETTTRLLKGTKRTLSVSAEGLWLRQGSADGQTVIRALGANLDGTRLTGVTFLGIGKDGVPTYRIEAISAELEPGAWFLTGTKEWRLDSAQKPRNPGCLSRQLAVAIQPDPRPDPRQLWNPKRDCILGSTAVHCAARRGGVFGACASRLVSGSACVATDAGRDGSDWGYFHAAPHPDGPDRVDGIACYHLGILPAICAQFSGHSGPKTAIFHRLLGPGPHRLR